MSCQAVVRGFAPARRFGGVALAVLLLAVRVATAQSVPKPAIPTVPSAVVDVPDTAHPITQHTPNGVRFVVHERGTGPLAQAGRRVAVRYTGFLPDGHVFDATVSRGNVFRFRVGRREAIAGWDELFPLLTAGSRVRAWVPATLAYGAKGVRDPDDDTRFLIPPDTELVFELQIISVR